VKAIQDARDTRETYRLTRLAYDSAERNLTDAKKTNKNLEGAQAARDAAYARYQGCHLFFFTV
jgi:hypothetical protein